MKKLMVIVIAIILIVLVLATSAFLQSNKIGYNTTAHKNASDVPTISLISAPFLNINDGQNDSEYIRVNTDHQIFAGLKIWITNTTGTTCGMSHIDRTQFILSVNETIVPTPYQDFCRLEFPNSQEVLVSDGTIFNYVIQYGKNITDGSSYGIQVWLIYD